MLKKHIRKITTLFTKFNWLTKLAAVGLVATVGTLLLVFAHADTPHTVHFILFCSNNSPCDSSRIPEIDSMAQQIQRFYQGQVGKTFTLVQTSVVKGDQSTDYYRNDNNPHGANNTFNCDDNGFQGQQECYAYANILATYTDHQPNEVDLAVLDFPTNEPSYCGLGSGSYAYGATNDGYGQGDPNYQVGGLGVFDITSENGNCHSGVITHIAHELGHGFGLQHTTGANLMNPGSECSGTLAGCSLYRSGPDQPQYLSRNLWFNTTVSSQPSNPGPGTVPPPPTPQPPTVTNSVVNVVATPSHNGTWGVSGTGQIFSHGDAVSYGDLSRSGLQNPVVAMAAVPYGGGYWMVTSNGGVYTFGDAQNYGAIGGKTRLNQPIVGMAATPSGHGYWLVSRDGGIFTFGDAYFLGSAGSVPLNRPIVGMAATSSGYGYWLVASDGGIFNYGDARFFGSTGAIKLNQPIVGMAATSDNQGYWLVAHDGGIFTFGDALFEGSAGGGKDGLIAGISTSRSSKGYWLMNTGGQSFPFGDANGGNGDSVPEQDPGFTHNAHNNATLNLKVSGYGGEVKFISTQHSLGDCGGGGGSNAANNPIKVTVSKTCTSGAGYGLGEDPNNVSGHGANNDGTDVSVPTTINSGYGYVFTNWTISGATSSKGWSGTKCANPEPANAACVNIPPGAAPATLTANYTQNLNPNGTYAHLTLNVSGDSNPVNFTSSPHSLGSCGGGSSNQQIVVTNSRPCTSGDGYGIGQNPQGVGCSPSSNCANTDGTNVTTQTTLSDGATFVGWSISGASTNSGWTGPRCPNPEPTPNTICVNIPPSQSGSITAVYSSNSSNGSPTETVNINVNGPAGPVTFSSTPHTIGDCNPNFGTFYVTGNHACHGTKFGYSDGTLLTAPSSVTDTDGSTWAFDHWGVTHDFANYSNNTPSSCFPHSSKQWCINMQPNDPNGLSQTGTAYYVKSASAPSPSYLNISVNGAPSGTVSAGVISGSNPGNCVSPFALPANCNSTTAINNTTIRAYPNSNYAFQSWSNCPNVTSGGDCLVNVPQGQTLNLTANYTQVSTEHVTLVASGLGSGVTANLSFAPHTLGDCGFSQSVDGNGKTCNGVQFGPPDGTLVTAPATITVSGGQYQFQYWGVTRDFANYSNNTPSSCFPHTSTQWCVDMQPNDPNGLSQTGTAFYKFVASTPPSSCQPVAPGYAKICFNLMSSNTSILAYVDQHSLGDCQIAYPAAQYTYNYYYISQGTSCNGYRFGPMRLYGYGGNFSFTLENPQPQTTADGDYNNRTQCINYGSSPSSFCIINFGNGSPGNYGSNPPDATTITIHY